MKTQKIKTVKAKNVDFGSQLAVFFQDGYEMLEVSSFARNSDTEIDITVEHKGQEIILQYGLEDQVQIAM